MSKTFLTTIGLISVAIVIAALSIGNYRSLSPASPPIATSTSINNPQSASSPVATTPSPTSTNTIAAGLAWPISNAQSRVTKKPFGIYITPLTSPVQPERFTGYHTGADFETTPDEQNVDVPIFAICDGPLLMKKYANGYGGVAVEKCTINNQTHTVIYGHLRLSSISPNVGDQLMTGQQIAVLGTGYSSETDGERKHLHLGIHKGNSINILGYAQNQSELRNWLDPMSVLK